MSASLGKSITLDLVDRSEESQTVHVLARVDNSGFSHAVEVATNGRSRSLAIPAKPDGHGSDVNGGELLFLALATCYCNDLYREAAKRGIEVDGVEVTVEGDFGSEGEPARNIAYRARVRSDADPEQLRELLRATDAVAEIHRTVRDGCAISFELETTGADREDTTPQ